MLSEPNFEIWILPRNLRTASEKVSILLRRSYFEILCLNVQRELEELIEDLALGAPYENFIEQVEKLKLIREPICSWEYGIKPILLALRGLKLRKPNLRIICYKSSLAEDSSIKNATKIAALIFRVNSTGKIDVKEWRSLIYEIIEETDRFIDEEAYYLLRALSGLLKKLRGKALCISDFSGKHLMRYLKKNGVKVRLRYIFTPYYFTPLEVLMREASKKLREGKEISDERLVKLVRLHAEYIREYVLTSINYDDAYFRWVKNKRFAEYF